MILQLDDLPESECNEPPVVVVRVRTTSWADPSGLHFRRDVTPLKRRCAGENFLIEDLDAIGASETLGKIENLWSCDDGVYEVAITNVSRDWETGQVDDWSYRLVPTEEHTK